MKAYSKLLAIIQGKVYLRYLRNDGFTPPGSLKKFRYEFRLREPLQLSMEEICRDIQLRTDKRHTPWSGMLLMDARTCIQMEKICHDIFLAYRLGKRHDKFLPLTTVVAHVIRTLSEVSFIYCKYCVDS